MSDRQDVTISKTLSWILRHGAMKEELVISADGYIAIYDILNHKNYKGKFNLDDIRRVAGTNDKQRFTISDIDGVLKIKANQGHTIKEITELSLIPIREIGNFDVIHGTYFKAWNIIKTVGLSCMKRNHIHFAKGLPGNKAVISGLRSDAQVYIYINLNLALADNLQFFISENGVILSSGDDKGLIKPKYFLKVVTCKGILLQT